MNIRSGRFNLLETGSILITGNEKTEKNRESTKQC